VTLNHDTSVAQALATLAQHGILSAPVVTLPDLLDAGECNEQGVGWGWFGLACIFMRGLLTILELLWG
jgi:CBS domain-containing protein